MLHGVGETGVLLVPDTNSLVDEDVYGVYELQARPDSVPDDRGSE